jgi:hypothetical protein
MGIGLMGIAEPVLSVIERFNPSYGTENGGPTAGRHVFATTDVGWVEAFRRYPSIRVPRQPQITQKPCEGKVLGIASLNPSYGADSVRER